MAPPRIFDAARREAYLDALAEGLPHNQAAMRAGVHTNTVQRIRVSEPTFEAEVRLAYQLGRDRLDQERMDAELDDWERRRKQDGWARPSHWLHGRLQMLAGQGGKWRELAVRSETVSGMRGKRRG